MLARGVKLCTSLKVLHPWVIRVFMKKTSNKYQQHDLNSSGYGNLKV